MTEELLTAWRTAEFQTRNRDLTTEARDEAEAEARLAHERYRDRIDSLDDAARQLGSRRASEESC